MIFKDYYKILGLENNKANINEIKIAFREQAKKYHPDVNEGKYAEERFKDINEAYRVLSDNKQKRKYDRIWYSNVGRKIEKQKDNQDREIKTDFLGILFGNNVNENKEEIKTKKKVPIKGENIETEIDLGIEEAYYGLEKKLSLRTIEGKVKTFNIKIPAGIRNGEKIRLLGARKTRAKWSKEWRLIYKNKC